MRDSPQGWSFIRLRNAGTWLSGGTPATDDPRYWGGKIPWISAASLKHFRIVDSERHVSDLGAHAGTQVVPAGTVVFLVRGMSLKSEFRVGVAERRLAFGQDCKAIMPMPGIDGAFLALAMKACTNKILRMVDESGHGTGRLPTDLISHLEIGFPPILEQRQIVEILDVLDRQIHSAEDLLKKLELIRVAMTDAMMGGLPASLVFGQVLAETPKNGIYKPLSEYDESGIAIVRIDSIQNWHLEHVASLPRVRLSSAEARAFAIEEDDILINRVNSIEYVGKSALVQAESEPRVFESNIMRCRVKEKLMRPAFAALWLSTPQAMRYFRSCAKSAIAQASINQQDVQSCPIPSMSLSDQDRVVERVQAVDQQATLTGLDLAKLQILKQGLVDDLLTGQVRVPVTDYAR